MKFGSLIKTTRPDLIISNRYDAWMKENSNPTYSQEALDFGREQLMLQSKPRDRRGTFSASSLNTCQRRQQFTFLGMPELPPTPKTAAIFQNGTFMHIRWQMAGITEGFLKAAEVPVGENDLGLSGTMDAIAYEDSVVEFKSINTYGFGGIATFGPKEDHLAQGGTYVACTGAERVTFIYEDKNTQEYKEFVKTADELPIAEIWEQADRIQQMVIDKKLAEPLGSCIDQEGFRYNNCQFKDKCLAIRGWDEAEEKIEAWRTK